MKPVFGELALFWCSTVKSNGTPKIVIAKKFTAECRNVDLNLILLAAATY